MTYILPLTVCGMGLHLFQFLVGSVKRFSAWVRFGRSRSSKVTDFGTNRKRACDFLLVRYSNLGPLLHRFTDIAGFFAHDPSAIPPKFWECSRWTRSLMLGSVCAGTLSYSAVKLFLKYSNLRDHGTRYLNVTDRQTDRRTDKRTDGRTDRRHAVA